MNGLLRYDPSLFMSITFDLTGVSKCYGPWTGSVHTGHTWSKAVCGNCLFQAHGPEWSFLAHTLHTSKCCDVNSCSNWYGMWPWLRVSYFTTCPDRCWMISFYDWSGVLQFAMEVVWVVALPVLYHETCSTTCECCGYANLWTVSKKGA